MPALRAAGRRRRGSRRASRTATSARSSPSPGSPTSGAYGCSITGSSSTCVKPMSVDVLGELVGELEVGERPVALERVQPPGAEVHLVDRDRPRRSGSTRAPPREPVVVAATRSCESKTTEAFCGGTSVRKRERVGLQPQLAVRASGSRTCTARPARRPGTNSSQMPGRAERAHRVQPAVPAVEVADHADRARRSAPRPRTRRRRRRPARADVRAEPLVELLVPPLAGEVEVELAERRQERVRVARACTCRRPGSATSSS